jgi:hypothetical protein
MENNNFGWALEQLKAGDRIRRKGWDKWEYLEIQYMSLNGHDIPPIVNKFSAKKEIINFDFKFEDLAADDWELA